MNMDKEKALPSSDDKFSVSLPSTVRLNECPNLLELEEYVILEVEHKELKMSKNRLAELSPYFKAMFQDFAEERTGRVCLKSIDSAAVELVFKHADAESEITESISEAILPTAHFFMMNSLVNKCLKSQKTDSTNCFDLLTLARVHNDCAKEKEINQYILQHFTDVSQTPEFLEQNTSWLINLLENDSLQVENERHVLDAVIQWIHFKEDRIKDLGRVLKQVRLAHVEPISYVYDCYKSERILRNSTTAQKLLEKVEEYHFFPTRRLTNQSSVTRRRCNSPQVEALRIDNKSHHVCIAEDDSMFRFPVSCSFNAKEESSDDEDDNERKFLRCFSRSYNPCYMSVEIITETLYVIKRLIPFDCERGKFMLEASMPFNYLFNAGVTEADGFWYTVGGYAPEIEEVSTVHRFDPATNTWTQLTPLPIPVYLPKVVSMTGQLFVLGNSYPSEKLVFFEYQMDEDVWIQRQSLAGSFVVKGTPCALNNCLYVFCQVMDKGVYQEALIRNVKTLLFEYNAYTRSWRECAPSTNPILDFVSSPVLLNGKVFVLQRRGNSGLFSLDYYDPSCDTWSTHGFQRLKGTIEAVSGPYLMKREWEYKPKETPKARSWGRWAGDCLQKIVHWR